jgi:hypothetical protein
VRRRLAFLAGAASEVRASVRRARARRRSDRTAQASADEIKRRLDETRRRLKSEIPPREDPE